MNTIKTEMTENVLAKQPDKASDIRVALFFALFNANDSF